HPCYKQEFDYKLTIIKQLLKHYQNNKHELLDITQLKAFVRNNPYIKSLQSNQESTIGYGELAKGTFKNLAQDKTIHAIFESIREIIKCSN
ncbi:MAG: hypothetical protein K2I63_01090, partial [Helicobacter sp.]|nr:hypothetical protein [Helicobacter sp.]